MTQSMPEQYPPAGAPAGGAPMPPAQPPVYQAPASTTSPVPEQHVTHTRSSAAWAGLLLGGLVLVLLLVFILQNGGSSTFHFLGFDFTLPRGVALLLAAVCGAAITALVGGIRIFQLRRAYRKARRN
jgi:uncharacterized integral membrane protein